MVSVGGGSLWCQGVFQIMMLACGMAYMEPTINITD